MGTEIVVSDLAVPPGEYLEEVLDSLSMPKEELARRMGRPASKLSQIFNGTKRITEETALQLETVVGVPAHIWTGLESEYRLTLARNEERKKNDPLGQAKLVSAFCYKQLAALGLVPDTKKLLERVHALRRFFGVTDLARVLENPHYQHVAFRCGTAQTRSPEALAAWLCMGERFARTFETAPFDPEKLTAMLKKLRSLTAKSPQEFEAQLRPMFAACGVALVICPHFPKTRAQGATFRMGQKAVLMITVRGAWADIFWFTLFHEVAHILLHSSEVIIEDGTRTDLEDEADAFARDLLIPPLAYEAFVNKEKFTHATVESFAHQIGVHPGIVVGRLHHDKKMDHSWLNDMRVHLHHFPLA